MSARDLVLLRRGAKAGVQSRLVDRRAKARRRSIQVPFMDWARRVPEPGDKPLDFERFPFQVEFYEETPADREIVVKKATQIGVSAYLVRWTLYYADVAGWTMLYVFPNDDVMWDFSDHRVRTIIQSSDYLLSRVPRSHVQNKGLKQVGSGFCYYRGSKSKTGLDSVPADALCLDEYDTLVQENVPDAERRVTGSEHGLVRRVGVPSIPEFGISELYEASDKRQWFVRCEGCGEWQPIDFWKNVDEERELVVCARCRKPLDVSVGQWVAEWPDRDVKGYHAPRLIVPRVARNENGALGTIIRESKRTEVYRKQIHLNKDLALDWAPEDAKLSREAIVAAQSAGGGYRMVGGYRGASLVTMGVDVASVRDLTVRISEHFEGGVKRALWIGEVSKFSDLDEKMREFGVNMAVVDHLPERRLAQAFAERFPGLVYLVAYAERTAQDVVMKVNEETRLITVRRTESMDAMAASVRAQRNQLPLDLPEGYVRQMMAPTRFVEKDELGRMHVGYRSTGPDDFAQAEVYDTVATEAWWYRQAVDEAQRETFKRLEDDLEFQRSRLDEPHVDYSPGPEEPDVDDWEIG